MSLNKNSVVPSTVEATMIIINALRDFADGLTRGVSLFFTERNQLTEKPFMPGRISRTPR